MLTCDREDVLADSVKSVPKLQLTLAGAGFHAGFCPWKSRRHECTWASLWQSCFVVAVAAEHQYRTVLLTWNWHTFCQLHVLFLFPCHAAVAEIPCCEKVRARSPMGLLCGFWSMEMEGVCRPCSQLCHGKDLQALCTVGINKQGVLLP